MSDEELQRYADLIKLMGEDGIILVLRSLSSAAVLEGMEQMREIYEREEGKVFK
jgi:ketol-acid reductoisomerase